MEIDYRKFLFVGDDGEIWWTLEIAVKLGAGYLPYVDDDQDLIPRLCAPNNRVRADEQTILGAVHDPRLGIEPPQIVGRDDGHFVCARDFLSWLGHYFNATQSLASFPDTLLLQVIKACPPKDRTAEQLLELGFSLRRIESLIEKEEPFRYLQSRDAGKYLEQKKLLDELNAERRDILAAIARLEGSDSVDVPDDKSAAPLKPSSDLPATQASIAPNTTASVNSPFFHALVKAYSKLPNDRSRTFQATLNACDQQMVRVEHNRTRNGELAIEYLSEAMTWRPITIGRARNVFTNVKKFCVGNAP